MKQTYFFPLNLETIDLILWLEMLSGKKLAFLKDHTDCWLNLWFGFRIFPRVLELRGVGSDEGGGDPEL